MKILGRFFRGQADGDTVTGLTSGDPMTPKIILFCAIFLMLCRSSYAASDPVGCPATISVSQHLTTDIAGWRAVLDDTPHLLANIMFYEGLPEERTSLVNDATTKTVGKETATWRFLPRAGRQIWVTCNYAGTAVTLAKSLPAKISACSVTYNTRQSIGGMPVIERVSCK